MKYLKNLPIYLLSLVFVVFGALFFFMLATGAQFPAMENNLAGQFSTVLMASGYMYLVKTLEVVLGALLLVPRVRPLALVLIAPISVNIFLYDILFAHAAGFGIILIILNAIALYQHRSVYAPMVQAH